MQKGILVVVLVVLVTRELLSGVEGGLAWSQAFVGPLPLTREWFLRKLVARLEGVNS